MKPSFLVTLLALPAALTIISCGRENPGQDTFLLEEADPFIGTGLHGHTYPGATAPFGMVQLSPDTRNTGWDGCSGYHDSDSTILGFSHTHLSGTGGGDLGDFLFTPAIGEVPLQGDGFHIAPLPFSKQDETARPGYYKVLFPSRGITAEMTASSRTGCHHYTFEGEGERHLLVDLRYNIGETRPDNISFQALSDRCIQGGRHVSGWAKDRSMYFSAAFSIPFTACTPDGKDRYLLTFPPDTKEVTVSIGLSPVDAEGAERNRLEEAPECDFQTNLKASETLWREQFGKIVVKGGTPVQRTNFYSSLYHALIAPNLLSDVDGRYRDHRQEVAQVREGRKYYSTLSLWDTFRTWNPLQTLLNQDLVNDMVFSLLSMYDCDGKLPLWPLGGADTDCMIGYHSIPVIADAWLRGIRGFDGEKALRAMIVSSDSDPTSAWYDGYGYIPSDLTPESVSRTLEFCYDDWCIARMAESMGHMDIAGEYDQRALRYRNLFDPSTGFFRGKDSEGNWRAPFEPTGPSRDYTEATAWQYRFFVAHDMGGFQALMGGREATQAALDSLFSYDYVNPDVTDGNVSGLIGQYAHGNEPSHASAYLPACAGDPSTTQRRVRQILDDMYEPVPEGLCGNEDCGQMSAWYVLSALGLYPVCPGSGEFVFAAPLFPEAVLTLPDGKRLTIRADHPEYPYIKEVRFNGKPVDAQFLRFEEMMQGGEIAFRLSRKPCHGRDGLKAPYSMTGQDLVSTPYLTENPRFFDRTFQAVLLSRTPDAQIRYTLDGSEPTAESALYEAPFQIDGECILSARAFKDGCTPSPLLSLRVFPIEYLPPVSAPALRQGCRYTYHRGLFTRVSEVEASRVLSQGIMPAPSIKGAPDADHFGYVFSGYLDVPEEGLWEFSTTSDDGSVLELDGRLIVNNDGSHGNFTATGHAALLKGLHSFRLLYLEDFEGQNLGWAWKRPGKDRFEPIPETAILHE